MHTQVKSNISNLNKCRKKQHHHQQQQQPHHHNPSIDSQKRLQLRKFQLSSEILLSRSDGSWPKSRSWQKKVKKNFDRHELLMDEISVYMVSVNGPYILCMYFLCINICIYCIHIHIHVYCKVSYYYIQTISENLSMIRSCYLLLSNIFLQPEIQHDVHFSVPFQPSGKWLAMFQPLSWQFQPNFKLQTLLRSQIGRDWSICLAFLCLFWWLRLMVLVLRDLQLAWFHRVPLDD